MIKRSISFAAALLGLTLPTIATANPTGLAPVPMVVPSVINRSIDTGHLDPSQALHISVSLPYGQPAAMQQFVDDVSNPTSPNYRQFLTPEQIGQRFGLPTETVQKIANYLTSQGMKVTLIGKAHLSILAEATAAQAEAAFHTRLETFKSPDGFVPTSGPLFAFTSVPQLPADIAGSVIDIGGLESFSHASHNTALTPSQLHVLYDSAPLYNAGTQGSGRTMGISSWDGYRLSNLKYAYTYYGLPTPPGGLLSNVTVVTIDGGTGKGSEAGEADLDIQASLEMAPLANLRIYDGSGSDLINVLTKEQDENLADMISESYGWSGSSSTFLSAHNLHVAMSAQGITYMSASGDSGTSISSYPYPDIEPESLVVGGTSAYTNASGVRSSEVAWSGSGGGWVVSSDTFNVLPVYQHGNGVPTNINYRLCPDVALDADPNTGYLVYLDGEFQQIGGTSGASPTTMGQLALSEEALISLGAIGPNSAGYYRLGRINDVVYSFNGSSSVFYDITSGKTGKLPNGVEAVATAGWDFTTGWGPFDFDGFVTAYDAGVATFTFSPTSGEGGYTPIEATVHVTTAAPSGGTVFTISGGDSSISYPTSVTIPAGQTSVSFPVSTSPVGATDTESLIAISGSLEIPGSFAITPTSISSLGLSPTTVVGGSQTSTATITLAHPAAASGDVVAISGGDSSISYPSSVTVPSGATSVTFTVSTSVVTTTHTENLTATLGASTATATLSVVINHATGVSFSPSTVTGGASSTGTVTLLAAAGPSGAVVTLSGGDSSVSYPATVTVPSGASSATFTVTTVPVSVIDHETIKATYGGYSYGAILTVNPATLSAYTLSTATVIGGSPVTGTVTLSSPAGPAGAVVTLTGGDSNISYPGTVTVAAGATSANYTITTSVVSSTDKETLTAKLGTTSKTATLTVTAPLGVASVTFSPTSVTGGVSSTGKVTLNAPATGSGQVVNLSGGDSFVSYPASVTVAAGSTTATFTVTTLAVSTNDVETISGSSGAASASGTLTVKAATVGYFSASPSTIQGGKSTTATLKLNGAAGPSGIVVTLSGGDSSISYPPSVTFAAGTSSTTFKITSSAVTVTTTETITATGPDGTTKTITITLTP